MKKYRDVVPEKAPLIILDRKSAFCMSKNGKDTKHTRKTDRRIKCVINGQYLIMHKTVWYERDLQMVEIGTNNVR